MSDYIVRATGANGQIRAFAADTRDLVERARDIHQTSPVATAALGRLLTGAVMMGVMMKGKEDVLTLSIRCEGPIKGLLATAGSDGTVKGYVREPLVMLPPSPKGKLDVGGAVGSGILSVVRDIGLKDPYTGQINLVSGEIAEDLTYYFAASEQVPSSVGLGVLMNKNNTVRRAGGFIIQLMPFAEEAVIRGLEKRIAETPPVTSLLDQGMTAEMILKLLLGDESLSIAATIPARYSCNCSRERVEKAVYGMGRKELEQMISEAEPVEVNCHFCGSHYIFTPSELNVLLK